MCYVTKAMNKILYRIIKIIKVNHLFRSLLYIIELSELFENSLVSNVCLIVCFVQGSTGRPGRRGSRGRRGDKVRTGGSVLVLFFSLNTDLTWQSRV